MQIVLTGTKARWLFIGSVSSRTSSTETDSLSEMQSLQNGRPPFLIRKATILSRRRALLICFQRVRAKNFTQLQPCRAPLL